MDKNMATLLGLKSEKRSKRSFALLVSILGPHVIQPLAERFADNLFGNGQMPDLSIYDNQIADLQMGQENLRNQLNMQSTIFKINSEKKSEQIKGLKTTQNKLKQQLKIQQETVQQDFKEKQQQIDILQNLLNECNEKIQRQEEAQIQTETKIDALKKYIKSIYEGLELLTKQSNETNSRIDAIEVESRFNTITNNFIVLLARFQSEQKMIFSAIENSNRGFVDSYIITPLNLIEIMLNALPFLPNGYKFPVHPDFENSRKLYRLIKPHLYFYNSKIFFILTINLVKVTTYSLHKISSLPFSLSSSTFAFVLPQQPYLMIDQLNREYALVSESDFQFSCENIDNSVFLCTRILPYSIRRSNLECEIRIFLNNAINPEQCDIRLMRLEEPLFIQFIEHKTWFYVTPIPSEIMIRCSDFRKIALITNTGILQLGNCSASWKEILLEPYLDPKITKVFANYSTNIISMKKYVDSSLEPPYLMTKHIILPNKLYDLKDGTISINKISQTSNNHTVNNNSKKDTVNNYVITIVVILVFVTIIVAIIVSRDKLLRLGKLFR